MFYKLIENKRNEWLKSANCSVRSMLDYIEHRGMMRDAQLEAIKTYLFLKIACKGKPLWKLFVDGAFNEINIENEELTVETRRVFLENKAALALFQYSRLKDKNDTQIAKQLEEFIRHHAADVDYVQAFKDIFYGVNYADYLFSLPMGAGKTYLMAAFIYIDLYFAQNEPNNPVWAHNFLILAPSGLKSSIIPSLRTIQEFDPSWIFSEEEAARLKKIVSFEILDEQKSANNSNLVKNPNANKVNLHMLGGDMMGLVAITNAEKVILDRVDSVISEESIYKKEELARIRIANELRNVISKIPNLTIFIDEVHHASNDDIKLRQVVNEWSESNPSFCNVLGFSGTPYLESAKKVKIGGDFEIKNTNISNVVYYYPLIDGIDNFLKRPVVKSLDDTYDKVIKEGVREFLDTYRDTVYANGTVAKLAIYCGQIATLEEDVYPIVAEIVTEYGLNPTEIILKRHKGSASKKVDEKKYPEPEGSEAAFASLDTSLSKIKIVLLVEIGKEGWDCKSLTSVILPNEGACPTNKVLQTSCRCLRQTKRGAQETALIWLNESNAVKLNKELKQQQNITLKEFGNKEPKAKTTIERYSRMEKMQVPPIDFFQLRVVYETVEIEEQPDTKNRLSDTSILIKASDRQIKVSDLSGKILDYQDVLREEGEPISYGWWLQKICRESMHTLSFRDMKEYDQELRHIFSLITTVIDGVSVEKPEFDHQIIRSHIRKAFVPLRDFMVVEEIVPEKADLLTINSFKEIIESTDAKKYYPSQDVVKEIIDWDINPRQTELSAEQKAAIESLKSVPSVSEEMIKAMETGFLSQLAKDNHPERNQTYHYLPYHFDSDFENRYFAKELMNVVKEPLEFYFNGDDNLTDFKIRCYKQKGNHWLYDGVYVPDFLVLNRDENGDIDKICIIETKGSHLDEKFQDRLKFMKETFVPKNNQKFGRTRFEFLYLTDKRSPEERVQETKQMIKEFFKA